MVLSELRNAANAIVPPNKLPPELLRVIFFYLCPGARRHDQERERERGPPYTNLLAASRVCRHWRDIAVSAPELWTQIILAPRTDLPAEEEISIARLCMSRSGVRPLDFFCLRPDFPEELIPDRRPLRSLVYGYRAWKKFGDKLASFLPTESCLERLEIRGEASSAIARCTHWPNNPFGSLTSLNLIYQRDIDANIYSLLDALRCFPHLEELLLETDYRPHPEPQHPPERSVLTIPLHSLKRMHICRVSVGTTGRLLRALDLLPNRVFMRFTNVSTDLGSIFPEGVAPGVSPCAATKIELVYPSTGGVILHATNGGVYTRLAYQYFSRHSKPLNWIAERPGYSLKELWLHIDQVVTHYVGPPPHTMCDLETLVIETVHGSFYSTFFLMLSPDEDGVPYPLLSTLELRNVFSVKAFGNVLKARSDAGFRLRTLRIRWLDGCEARTAPLAQFVDELDFYHVTDNKTSRGLELPGECMAGGKWWEPWSRDFTGGTEWQFCDYPEEW